MDLEKITIYLQPIKKLDNDGGIKKYEALMRYPVDGNNMVYPDALISDLEPSDKFQATLKVLEKVLTFLKENENTEISINITFDDINDKNHREQLIENIERSKVGDRLILEFIEEKELRNRDIVLDFMKSARALGCRFALDDFGKGYATFDPLLSYEFDILKLDSVLVSGFTSDAKRFFILEMLIDMCERLNIETVAEYIENEEMYNSVKFIGCTYAQGFYEAELGEPKPTNEC